MKNKNSILESEMKNINNNNNKIKKEKNHRKKNHFIFSQQKYDIDLLR